MTDTLLRSLPLLPSLLAALGIGGALGLPAHADEASWQEQGALFVMTNSSDRVRGNEVVMYRRNRDGNLSLIGYFPAGRLDRNEPQLGSGPAPTSTVFGAPVAAPADALGSAQSLILGEDRRCLFAVNAGSNSVSSFRVARDGLHLASVVDSMGVFPVSLAKNENLLYVLNAGNRGALAGFHILRHCQLSALEGSSTDLSTVTDSFPEPAPGEVLTTPAQISFAPEGTRLVLSVKGGPDGNPAPAGRVAVFPVREGLLGQPVVTPFSANRAGPFSFLFANANTIVVAHTNSRSIASYAINSDHSLSVISGPFSTGVFAPCWLDTSTPFVYVANFGEIPATGTAPDGNGVLVGYRIAPNGVLRPLGLTVPYPAPALGHGNHAVDVKVIGRFLYFVQPRTGMVGRLTIGKQGALTDLVNFGGLIPGVEPFAGANPGINLFRARCFLQDPNDPAFSPECQRGSAVGIAGF